MNTLTTPSSGTDLDLDKQCAEFEAEWRKAYRMPDDTKFSQFVGGRYLAPAIDDAFQGWMLARRASPQPVAPEQHFAWFHKLSEYGPWIECNPSAPGAVRVLIGSNQHPSAAPSEPEIVANVVLKRDRDDMLTSKTTWRAAPSAQIADAMPELRAMLYSFKHHPAHTTDENDIVAWVSARLKGRGQPVARVTKEPGYFDLESLIDDDKWPEGVTDLYVQGAPLADDHAGDELREKQAAMLRADLSTLQSFVNDLDDGSASRAFYNVRGAIIEQLHATTPPSVAVQADEQLQRMRAAFHVNMMRAYPGKTHDEIAAEIDKACGTEALAQKAGAPVDRSPALAAGVLYPQNADPFVERDQSKTAEQQGAFRKFDVRRVDGKDAPGEKHHNCVYFVLDLSHDPFAMPAMHAYAAACEKTHPKLAQDIWTAHGKPADRAAGQDAAPVPAEAGEQQCGKAAATSAASLDELEGDFASRSRAELIAYIERLRAVADDRAVDLDGDALRQAMEYGIQIHFEGQGEGHAVWADDVMIWTDGDVPKATRSAIAQVAANRARAAAKGAAGQDAIDAARTALGTEGGDK